MESLKSISEESTVAAPAGELAVVEVIGMDSNWDMGAL
jgi:hypothetical protein